MKGLLICALLIVGNGAFANVDGAIEKLISRIDTKVWNGALDNLDMEEKREVRQGLKAVLDIIKGRRSAAVSCVASTSSSRKYTFHNGKVEFGGAMTFLSTCNELLETESKGLICGESTKMSGHQIYRTRDGKPIAGRITFKSDCVDSINSMNESGLFCAKNKNSKYQIFNSRTGKTVGGVHTFKSDCLSLL